MLVVGKGLGGGAVGELPAPEAQSRSVLGRLRAALDPQCLASLAAGQARTLDKHRCCVYRLPQREASAICGTRGHPGYAASS